MENKLENTEPRATPGRWPYLVTGLVIGSAAGAFAASEAGKKTREKIVDWGKTLGERLRRERQARTAREHRPIEKIMAGADYK